MGDFIPHFPKKAQCLHELVGLTANKPKRKARNKDTKGAETIPSK